MAYDAHAQALREAVAGNFHHEFGVPHTKLRLREDGFSVSFRRTSEYVFKMVHAGSVINPNASPPTDGNRALGYLIALLILLSIAILTCVFTSIWWVVDRLIRTVILVDPLFVTVRRRRMERQFFRGFRVHHTLTRGRKTVAVLAYGYGNRWYPFGGVWPEAKAEEVAAALNALYRLSPNAANEVRIAPEALRGEPELRF